MKTNRILLVMAVCVIVLCCNPASTFGGEGQHDDATCTITVTVETIIEWEDLAFPAIDLDAQHEDGPMDEHADTPEGTSDFTLWLNCDVAITANNTATARLTDGTDVLRTFYKISDDGDGVTNTGAAADEDSADWEEYDTFLTADNGFEIFHFNTDGAVEITLEAQARFEADEISDSGSYSATQMLTATWVADN